MPGSLGQNDGFLVKYSPDGQLAGHELRITSITRSNGAVIITWPGGATVRLQRAISPLSPDWQYVPGSLGESAISQPATNGTAFYRLLAQ